MAIQLLQTYALPERTERALAERFTVHRFHDAADPAALINEVGPTIRAIAGIGLPAQFIERLTSLEIIANFGVGYDSIDIPRAKARGIRVTNTPELLNNAVAELALGLMLSLARRLPQNDRFVRDGLWLQGSPPLYREIGGSTLGIVGMGRIGKEIAVRARAMNMRVVYHGRSAQQDLPYEYFPDLLTMAGEADWLLAILPGGAATAGIISRQVLEALGPEGMFVNVARGSVVDQAAMIDLLQRGLLGGAALDVFADEPNVPRSLIELENVVLSPHQGSATREARNAMGGLVLANLDAHFSGKPLLTPVA